MTMTEKVKKLPQEVTAKFVYSVEIDGKVFSTPGYMVDLGGGSSTFVEFEAFNSIYEEISRNKFARREV